MSAENEKIINPKSPSPHDLSVLDFMNAGNSIHHTLALSKFKTTALRDIIYRLKCAGNVIHSKWVYYAVDATTKKYKLYWTTGEIVMPAKYKTERALKADGKDLVAISKNIQNIKVVQTDLFKSASI